MKRLLLILLAVCMLLCACANTKDTETSGAAAPEQTADAAATQETGSGSDKHAVEVPENLRCVYFTGETFRAAHPLEGDMAKRLYEEVAGRVPDRKKSNPGYAAEGSAIQMVFYVGDEYNGTWDESYTYHGVYLICENGCLSMSGSPFTSSYLNYQLTPSVYTLIAELLEIEA